MSNIAGKSYAMNVVTPIRWWTRWFNRGIFLAVTIGTKVSIPIFSPFIISKLKGLMTLSLIHYARWAIVRPCDFPHLDASQPRETIKYTYMFFFSNFNGSWTQYVDSFHMAIPTGLNLFWKWNVRYPHSVPLTPFHDYITYNQIWTNHYYNAYPLAASNDVKAAKALRDGLLDFIGKTVNTTPEEFKKRYDAFLNDVQPHISVMEPTPVVSLANQAVQEKRRAG